MVVFGQFGALHLHGSCFCGKLGIVRIGSASYRHSMTTTFMVGYDKGNVIC